MDSTPTPFQASFVNSIAIIKGGTHVDHFTSQIIKYVVSHVNKRLAIKHKDAKTTVDVVKTRMWIFVNAVIDSPTFDSQMKEH
ncbi:Dna topoisomerase [Thalictrum thalictroides]|uniref:DNA topoisomerase (ATP-hydrolyzing) n=1 Tax=Thalictrum thalictroides TaxID=46969 RepID=A0A7J6UYI0_THATH|nr:Dna topoisomerase [Thalictrum thalictroides]